MRLDFTKMHGLGNDFVIIDAITQNVALRPEQIRRLGDRNTGVGFDQLLVVEPPNLPDVDFSYRIFNRSGEEVEHCGNGARCFALFVHEKKLTRANPIRVATTNRVLSLAIDEDNLVTVDMGEAKTAPGEIPFLADEPGPLHHIHVEGETFEVGVANVGNPHVVMKVDRVEDFDVAHWGPAIQNSGLFPEGVNVGFLQVLDREEGRLRVYERGVGETRACGTGACAAAAIAAGNNWMNANLTLRLNGGQLHMTAKPGESILMKGPGAFVFDGSVRL